MIPQRKRKSKYFAKKVEYDGIVFDSKLEGARYKILKGMEDQGYIYDLEVQIPYECVVRARGSANIYLTSGISAEKMSL